MTKLRCQATTLSDKTREREGAGGTRTPGCCCGTNTPRVPLPVSQTQLLSGTGLAFPSGVHAGFIFFFFLPLKFHTDRYTRTLLQLKVTKWNIAAIFLWRRGAYKFTPSKVSLTSAIHQTMQPHQSESIRNYSPSKLHWKALICYWSLLLFSSILKDWKQKSNNVTETVKCNFYWDWWEPICHNICF